MRENREIKYILYLKWVKVYKSCRHFYFQLISRLWAFIGGLRLLNIWLKKKWSMVVCLGGLNNRNLSSHSFGGCKSEIRVSEGLAFSDASLPGLWMAVFSLPVSSHGLLSVYICVLIFFFSHKDSSLIGLGPTWMTSF